MTPIDPTDRAEIEAQHRVAHEGWRYKRECKEGRRWA
jgi:hypothetical protein